MAYTATQIVIAGIAVTEIHELKLSCQAGEHAVLKLSGYVGENTGESTLHELKEYSEITVHINIDGSRRILFSGVITNVKITGKSQTDYLEIEAKSKSFIMDIKKKSRSFQNTNMTIGELVSEIMKDYPESDIKLSIPDKPIGEIAVQYRETDWEFVKRVLSVIHIKIACNQTSNRIQLYAGIPSGEVKQQGSINREILKEMGVYDYWLQEGMDVSDTDFLIYTIETNEMVQIFDQIKYKERDFVVRSTTYEMVKGMLNCICELQRKQGIMEPVKYPMHLIGVALKGKIVDAAGEKVKVHLEIDEGRKSQNVYWFPFSTLSASPDGSGWYYMPEKGDQIRVCFPSKHMKDVIAISAVSTYEGKDTEDADKMGNPSTKSLSNAYGQEMSMGEDGINLTCRGGASLKIGNDGSIALAAQKQVNINAENNIEITSETDMIFHGSQVVALTCTQGAQIVLSEEGNLHIKGTEVFVD